MFHMHAGCLAYVGGHAFRGCGILSAQVYVPIIAWDDNDTIFRLLSRV